MPTIRKLNDNTFEVVVNEAVETHHKVKLDDTYHQNLTDGNIGKEELIKASFEFLLARESNSMIMREFDLPVIGTYFPSYELEMKNRFR